MPSSLRSASRYGLTAQSLHWLIALLIFSGFALGVFMHELPVSADKLRYYSWHKWIGVSVFLLAALRVANRVLNPPPPLLPGAAWEHRAAHLAHGLLYLLMFAIPLSGWLHSSAAGYTTVYFGVLPLPDLLDKNEALSETLGEVHELLNFTLLGVLVAHAGAALLHHLVRRDGTLPRMLPGGRGAGLAILFTLAGFSAIALSIVAEDEGPAEAPAAATATADGATAAVAAAGELSAEFRQMNVPVTGSFKRFSIETLTFDPATVAAARAVVSVDMTGFDIGDEDYNAEVRKAEWFDSAQFPQARFESSAVRALGGDRYEATGTLTIKGRSAPITVTFALADEGGARVYSGEATLSRAAYGIGDAEWNDVLDDAVIVKFRLREPRS